MYISGLKFILAVNYEFNNSTMKLADVDKKTLIEDFITLKKSELITFLRKNHEKISSNKPELSSRSGDNEKMQCYRQFIRGFNFYKENYIHNIMMNSIDDESKFCYIRSKCIPSMKTGTYEQWILMSKEKPFTVSRAYCTCPAGLGEACTHVAGLLFALEANSAKQNELSCTCKKCNWNKGGKRKKEAKEVSEIRFKKLRYGEETNGASKKKEIKLPSNAKSEFLVSLTSRLANSFSRPVLFDLLPAEKSYDINDEINVGRYEEIITSEAVSYESDNYIDMKMIIQKEQIVNEQEMYERFNGLSTEVVDEIENRTRGQSENALWQVSRQFRITSSNFFDIINRKKVNVENLVCKFTVASHDIETPALCHGKKYEKNARNKYIAYKNLHHNEKVSVRECGIFLSNKFGFLGASPDGIVKNSVEMCREWVLEIKCPFKWRFKTIKSACEDKDFCCEIGNDGTIQLKRSHIYYAQIQGQMAICHSNKCDFVIFSFKDFLILEIDFDEDYWAEAELKLIEFYKKHMIPELAKYSVNQ